MRRLLIPLVLSIALLAAACSTAEDGAVGPTEAPAGTEAPSSTASPSTEAPSGDDAGSDDTSAGDDSTTSSTDGTPAPEGPAAPDFTLALGEDQAASFTLSDEAKPVYMVFWAEW